MPFATLWNEGMISMANALGILGFPSKMNLMIRVKEKSFHIRTNLYFFWSIITPFSAFDGLMHFMANKPIVHTERCLGHRSHVWKTLLRIHSDTKLGGKMLDINYRRYTAEKKGCFSIFSTHTFVLYNNTHYCFSFLSFSSSSVQFCLCERHNFFLFHRSNEIIRLWFFMRSLIQSRALIHVAAART